MLLTSKFATIKLYPEPNPGWDALRQAIDAERGAVFLLVDKYRGDTQEWWLKVLYEGGVWWAMPWDVECMRGEKLVLDEVE